MTLAFAVLLASLLGSVHCVAMCGAFSCLYAAPGAMWRSTRTAHAAYHLGRLAAYIALGLLAGALGAGFNRGGAWAGVPGIAAVVAAVLLMVWGANAILIALGRRAVVMRPPVAWQHATGSVLQRFTDATPVVRALATGLCTSVLPCGWLYAFVVVASGSGSPWRGALLMSVFWLGTVPLMLAAAAGLQRLSGAVRARLPLLSATTILLLGSLSLAAHLGLLPVGRWLHPLMPAVPGAEVAHGMHP
ncbi:MAG: sulfite exporter TauE/SafE family protein [Gemmatimonadota bacterium]